MRMICGGSALLLVVVGCSPSDILSVPPPAGVTASSTLHSRAGAEGVFNGAKGAIFYAADGGGGDGTPSGLPFAELLTDEFVYRAIGNDPSATGANVDARITFKFGSYGEPSDPGWQTLIGGRESMLLAIPLLAQYEPVSNRSTVGEAYALLGYSELLFAEWYCAGTPLNQIMPGGGIQYGTPLTTDSMLGVAVAHFNTALQQTNLSDTVTYLASVGLGRALLDRGQFAPAAAAVARVPASFVYNAILDPNDNVAPYTPGLYADAFTKAAWFDIGDREGSNGLDFVSAHDPRLAFDTSVMTVEGTVFHFPLKFEANLSDIPFATGLEAQLIVAEAALKAGQTSVWLADLNALRNGGCTVSGADTTCSLGTGQVASQTAGLPSLSDPGSDSGRVSVMFRERAFWLFGTGTRLGDLRRLIRQYGRTQDVVFPTGVYANGENPKLPSPLPNYGTDVALTLPTKASGTVISNPSYRGCLTSTATP